MNTLRCLCSNRKDIRCDATHCDLAGPGKPGDPNECRICWLRLNQPLLFGREQKAQGEERRSPCLYLGDVLDKRGCACPAKWLRSCALHKVCNLQQCKICPDYEEA
jgi:hypothetical protein